MHGGAFQKIERRGRDWIVVTSLGIIKTTAKRHVKNGGRSAERTLSNEPGRPLLPRASPEIA